MQQQRPDSPGPGPGPSCVSMKSDASKDELIYFKGSPAADGRMQQQRPDCPGPGPGHSCLSMKSDDSMFLPCNFKGEAAAGGRMQQQRPDSGPSCVSMKSDDSMDFILDFKGEAIAGGRRKQQRPDSPGPGPGPSCVSIKSDWSMRHPPAFKCEPAANRRVQQISEIQVLQQHQTDLDSTFLLLEGNIFTFVKDELKKMKKVLSPGYPECLESEGEDEEQRSSREAFVKITLDFLRRMKKEDLADCLQISTELNTFIMVERRSQHG